MVLPFNFDGFQKPYRWTVKLMSSDGDKTIQKVSKKELSKRGFILEFSLKSLFLLTDVEIYDKNSTKITSLTEKRRE